MWGCQESWNQEHRRSSERIRIVRKAGTRNTEGVVRKSGTLKECEGIRNTEGVVRESGTLKEW